MQRLVAVHTDDPVGNDEMRRNSGIDIEDASINALPMQQVFQLTVSNARRHADRFFILRVTPAQWCVFTLGIETMKSFVKTVGATGNRGR
jgi:hypothetical protein